MTDRALTQVAARYEKDFHGEADAGFARELDDEFVDRFAVAGRPDEVRERLQTIGACGIERAIIVPGSLDSDPSSCARTQSGSRARCSPV